MADEENVGGVEDLDFNVDEEWKPEPLIPKGTYHAVVTKFSYDGSQAALIWDTCLQDNGGVMNDGSTPVDGAHVFFRNWLPKAGDENLPTKNGKKTKRQSKIDMLAAFQEKLGVNLSTPAIIADALSTQSFVGMEVNVEIDIEEYEGRFRNTVRNMSKR
jgi:hypothetical protein